MSFIPSSNRRYYIYVAATDRRRPPPQTPPSSRIRQSLSTILNDHISTVNKESTTSTLSLSSPEAFEYDAEVVGSTGRIGSFFLVNGGIKLNTSTITTSNNNNNNHTSNQHTGSVIACPRGLAPGSLTKSGTPIWVCTPGGTTWNEVVKLTLPHRRQDLVLVGNGIPSYEILNDYNNLTVVIPHFGILKKCTRFMPSSSSDTLDNNSQGGSPIVTSETSPPTFVYGRHAPIVTKVLQQQPYNENDENSDKKCRIQVKTVTSLHEIRLRAALKVLWSSCLWLLCHNTSNDDNGHGDNACNDKAVYQPRTIGQVYEQRYHQLHALVDELLPILTNSTIQSNNGDNEDDNDDLHGLSSMFSCIQRPNVDEYMESYSMSIQNAIPSKDLAISEVKDRNGIWLQHMTFDEVQHYQPYHISLLRQHFSEDEIRQLCRCSVDDNDDHDDNNVNAETVSERKNSDQKQIYFDTLRMGVWGRRRPLTSYGGGGAVVVEDDESATTSRRNVVIVGGGMIGSTIALALVRRRPTWNITLIDQLSSQDMGRTTKASWAWINANNKQPTSYQNLNHIAVQAWKRHSTLKRLVSWVGSLVRFNSSSSSNGIDVPAFISDGGYPAEGPLSTDRIGELEPMAQWNEDNDDDDDDESRDIGNTFFFPDEGCVDPFEAIQAVRAEAERQGVTFNCGWNVTNVIYDEEESTNVVCGIECVQSDYDNDTNTTMILPADLVIVAAGCGSKASFLGGLPLVDRPGRIEYARLDDTEHIDDDPSSPASGSSSSNSRITSEKYLQRILVDPARHSHILQRSNGDIVIGGGEGALEFGGAKTTRSTETKNGAQQQDEEGGEENEKPLPDDQHDELLSLLDLAKPLAPNLLENAIFQETHTAVRPMPRDGLPIVGYVAGRGASGVGRRRLQLQDGTAAAASAGRGLYVCVSHSGITLGPLLADLVVAEVTEHVDFQLLHPYRPDRF